jgi:hypothetical protein
MKKTWASLAILIVLGGGSGAASPSAPAAPYTMTLAAYAGLTGTDVQIQILAPAGQDLPAQAESITLVSGSWARVFSPAPLTFGRWTQTVAGLPTGSALTAYVSFRTSSAHGIQRLQANTVVMSLPNLRFSSIGAPTSAMIGGWVTFPVVLQETGGTAGAMLDLTIRGSAIDPVTATGIRVDAAGTTSVQVTIKFLATGLQSVRIETQGQVPADADPSDNSVTINVNVLPASVTPTQYYGGYFRSQGTSFDSYELPEGGTVTSVTDGRGEQLYVNATSSTTLTWPMDFTALALADGAPVIQREFSLIYPTDSFPDVGGLTEYVWIVDFVDSQAFRFLTTTGSVPQTGYYFTRSAADYNYLLTQNGETTSSYQLFGSFVNATTNVSMYGSLRSGAGRIGGWTPVLPITHTPAPTEGNDLRERWDAYGSGSLTP